MHFGHGKKLIKKGVVLVSVFIFFYKILFNLFMSNLG